MNIITQTPLTGRFVHKFSTWRELRHFIRACRLNGYRYFKEAQE